MVSSSSGRLQQLCSLDNDVIVAILSRLPVKSLLRFRCVCKSWRAIISDPSFARMHLSNMNSKSSKLLLNTSPLRSVDYEPLFKHHSGHVGRTRELDSPVMIPTSSSKLFGSFNGLICLALDYDNIILWNPCTGDSNLLPKPATFFPDNNGSTFYGFGYDSTTRDYKAVRGSFSECNNQNTVEVYAPKTGSWKIHRDINKHVRLNGQGCLLNEALHWVHFDLGSNFVNDITGLKIVSFDLAKEKLQVMMPIPHRCFIPNIDRFNFSAGIGTMANCLTLYMIPLHNDVRIWRMEEYGVQESWTEVIRIPVAVFWHLLPNKSASYLPLCISDAGEVLIKCSKNALALYDSKEMKLRSSLQTHVQYWFEAMTRTSNQKEAIIYVETLVSPQTGNVDAGCEPTL